jgi:hypothetical protein
VRLLTTKQFVPPRNPFGIAFDIDGVLLRGKEPIGRAPESLARLYKDVKNAELQVPYIFLTNGGGMTEAARAAELTRQLGVPIAAQQVCMLMGVLIVLSLSSCSLSLLWFIRTADLCERDIADYGFGCVGMGKVLLGHSPFMSLSHRFDCFCFTLLFSHALHFKSFLFLLVFLIW